MAPQRGLDSCTPPLGDRLELGDGPAASNDRELLTAFDGVEHVCEVASGVGRGHVCHPGQIIRCAAKGQQLGARACLRNLQAPPISCGPRCRSDRAQRFGLLERRPQDRVVGSATMVPIGYVHGVVSRLESR
jgi:hypothetical protein